MQLPATELTPSGSPNHLANRMASDSPRHPLAEVALVGGGALLVTSSVIQLLLWAVSYRDTGPIGQILLLMGIAGIMLALMIVRFGSLGLALAGAFYLAATTVLLLLITNLEVLGYQDGLATPFSGGSIIVPLMGVVLLAGTAWLISHPQRKPGPLRSPKPAANEEGTAQKQKQKPETAVAGASFDNVERVRWPAERPQMPLSTAPAPPFDKTQVEQTPAAEAPAVDQTPALSEVPAAEFQAPVVTEPAVEPQAPAEPATAEFAMKAEPAVERTAELAAVPEVVPDSIPEPVRSRLIREQQILDGLSRALGPDDPGTLTIRGNIAAHYLSAGDVSRAADLQEAVAADSARILGDAHPHTLTAQGKAAQWRKLAKKSGKQKVPVPG